MNNLDSCFFCEETSAGGNTLADNVLFRARRDLFPASQGHAEIITRRHTGRLEDLTTEELKHLMPFAKQVMKLIRDELPNQPDAFTIGINDGPMAGQSIPHFHLHLIPRWEGDVDNPRGGIRRIFPDDEYSNKQELS